jgi:UDP-2,3-diacylglucosamine pyrophosphatase LpxH
MKVVKSILNLAAKGTQIYYITGNHDETLRKFSNLAVGKIMITNKLELMLNGKKTWFFHGDVFDVIMQHSRWLEKAGAIGYDSLILLNVFINALLNFFGKGKISISKRIKENVKSAVKFISSFEQTAAVFARKKGYQVIVCGHIHQPEIKQIKLDDDVSIEYMNSGDWVENNTALEYQHGEWTLYHHSETFENEDNEEELIMELNNREIFKRVLKEFQLS